MNFSSFASHAGRVLTAAIALSSMNAAWSQASTSFPSRPIRLVVPFPAGGGTDLIARPLAANLSQALSVPVIVDNKAGGAAMIGSGFVAKAKPDGYTLLITVGSPIVINPAVFKKMTYDSVKDFTAVSQVSTMPVAIAVQKSFPANNLEEFVDFVKKSKQPLSFGSTGPGSASHIIGEVVNRRLGVDLTHIPYQGSAPAVNAVLAGHVTAVYADMAAIATQVDGGKLKVLAVTGTQRGRTRPDVKTFEEQGVKGLRSSWVAVFAPAGTPQSVLHTLSDAVAKAVHTKDISDLIIRGGMEPSVSLPAEMNHRVQVDLANWQELVKDIGGISLE